MVVGGHAANGASGGGCVGGAAQSITIKIKRNFVDPAVYGAYGKQVMGVGDRDSIIDTNRDPSSIPILI